MRLAWIIALACEIRLFRRPWEVPILPTFRVWLFASVLQSAGMYFMNRNSYAYNVAWLWSEFILVLVLGAATMECFEDLTRDYPRFHKAGVILMVMAAMVALIIAAVSARLDLSGAHQLQQYLRG